MEQVLTKIEPLRTQSEQAIQVDAQSVRASPLVEHEENMVPHFNTCHDYSIH